MKLEKRFTETIESGEGSIIKGYATKFNVNSKPITAIKNARKIVFIERISPNALDGVLENSDVLALIEHNKDKGVLARSRNGEGTLKLSIDEIGLKFEFSIPNTSIGNEAEEGIKRGDITNCSFAFRVADGGEIWSNENGILTRTITKIEKLRDISIVYSPAYEDTEVEINSRSFDEFMETQNLINQKDNINKELLNEYFIEMENKLKNL